MYIIGKKNILVLFSGEGIGESIGKWSTTVQKAGSDTIDKAVDTGKKGMNIAGNAISGASVLATDSEARDLAFRTKDAIEEAEKSTNPDVKKTLELLKATGTIEIGMLNQARVVARFANSAGKSGANAILGALNAAKNGVINIVLYANEKYTPMSMNAYEKLVSKDPDQLNKGVSKGLWGLYQQGSPLGFTKETWSNISVYCSKRNWDTRIIGGNADIKKSMETLYSKKKEMEEKTLSILLDSLLPDISKNDPKLAALLSRIYLEKNPNGTINASKAIEKMVITNLNEIPGKFKDIADAMRKDAKELFRIAKEVAKSTPIKSLSDLKIVGIGTGEILNRSFHSFNQDEIKKYTPIIQEHLKGIQDPKQIGDIKKILTILLALNTGFEKTRLAADAKLKSETTKKAIEKNPNITKEKLGESLDSSGEQEKAQFAQEISVSRASSDNKLDTIKEYGIDTLEKAQQKLQELEKKGNLSEEEKILKSELSGYIQSKIREAQVYKDYSSHLTESDKKEIFTQTNQFISGNPKETYNFQALEKIAVLTDPESTPTQRTLAQLEAGQSVSMDDLLRGNSEVSVSSAPELSQVTVSKNSDGTFNIPLFAARNITKDQVNEYKEDTRLYAKLGLSQLIPHIPLLTQELRNKGVNTAIDGKTGTMEQQQILKSLYAQLFGKEIISSSLAEVERAFSSALGNPTNMKNAMQGVLSTHHLITDSGQSIAPDTLQNWMRKNTQDNQKPTINLT